MHPLAFLILCLALTPMSLAGTTPPSLGEGIQLVPEKKGTAANHCKEVIQYFHLTGLKDPQRLKKINELIRTSVAISDGCSTNEPDPEDDMPYSFENKTEDVHKLGQVVVFKVLESSSTGGVHSNYKIQTHVIDLSEAQEVNLNPLFKSEGHERLLEFGRAKLRQYYARVGEKGAAEKGPDHLAIRTDQILPRGNGFEVQFNPYEVDCFAAGAPIITYSAEEASRIFVSAPLTRTLFGAQ